MTFDLGIIARQKIAGPLANFGAVGGTESIIYQNGVYYKVHEFTTSGTIQFLIVPGTVEYFVVAGGGAGGSGNIASGGGGAGGLLTGTGLAVRPGINYSVIVGAGGAYIAYPITNSTLPGSNGSNSSFLSITALGGGGGGVGGSAGSNGGSGGGGGHDGGIRGLGTPGQGNNGSNGDYISYGGGGGGAGGAARSGLTSPIRSIPGPSVLSTFNGKFKRYAGGGLGGGVNLQFAVEGDWRTLNSGGGGRGQRTSENAGTSGSAGIVIIRYPIEFDPTDEYRFGDGGEVSFAEENGTTYRVHTFNSSGVFYMFNQSSVVEYLVAAGGGAGGTAGRTGSGGGAGGVLQGVNIAVGKNIPYAITVGAGGSYPGNTGNNSEFKTNEIELIAFGGGGGSNSANGKAGGSGSGAGSSAGTLFSGGATLNFLQGNRGGNSSWQTGYSSGGGGGKSTAGGNATGGSSAVSGRGGDGITTSFNGTSIAIAGGGGGGGAVIISPSGLGGGPTANRAGGGHGQFAESGGSGIVMIRYPWNPPPEFQFPTGQVQFTTPGVYNWTCPPNVTKVSVVCVGGGGGGSRTSNGGAIGGSGGGLGWKNNIDVVPGNTYQVAVGAPGTGPAGTGLGPGTPGGTSYFISTSIVSGQGGGRNSTPGGSFTGDGGGNGGSSGASIWSGAGGAGGYTGNGGVGGNGLGSTGNPGSGGGGGGSGGSSGVTQHARQGGGVGLLGEGPSGLGSGPAVPGNPGSFGSGANFGGGGNSGLSSGTAIIGGPGAVRIIWGLNRAFPSTNTGNL